MKRSLKIKKIAIDSFFISLIILFTFVPNLGYISLGPYSFQIISNIVIIGAALFGFKRGTLYGLAFGLSSLIKVATYPAGWFDALFIYPWNSILPRLLFGMIAGLLFDLLKNNLTLDKYIIAIVPASLFLSLIHSFLVLSLVYLFSAGTIISNLDLNAGFAAGYVIAVLGSFVGVGVIGEMVLAGLIVPTVVSLLYKTNLYKYDGKMENSHNNGIINKESFRKIFIEELSKIKEENKNDQF